MKFQTIRIENQNQILTLTVARPEKLNALSVQVFEELKVALALISDGHFGPVQGLILSGEKSKAFIAGADISEMSRMSPEEGGAFAGLAQSVTVEIEQLPFPVIAAVDGFALGGGCEMALACDFIFATERAVFGQPEVKLGLIPGFGGCVRLKDRVGISLAKRLIYTGAQVPANKAFQVGLCDQVFATREEMFEAAQVLLREIGANSISAVAICKQVIQSSLGESTESALAVERQGFYRVFQTENKRIGVQAFLKKEKANFRTQLDSTLF